MMRLAQSVLLAALATTSAVAEDEFISFTSRVSLVATNKRAAWIEITRGDANIFGCDLPACRPHMLTNYSNADGVDLDGLTLGVNGDTLIYTRSHSAGANPVSDAHVQPLTTFAIDWPPTRLHATLRPPRALAPGGFIAATSNADRALFAISASVGRFSLAEVNVSAPATGVTTILTTAGVLGESCNGNPSATWSADGTMLAFVVKRLDHSYIAVWRRQLPRRIKWIAPVSTSGSHPAPLLQPADERVFESRFRQSMDNDHCPNWSPDGQSLAFIRLRAGGASAGIGHAAGIDGWLHQAPTFSVMVASFSFVSNAGQPTVTVSEAFREAADASYPGTGENGYGQRPLLWLAGFKSLLLGSEASGFTHVLEVDAGGDVSRGTNTSRDVTPWGTCEAQSWSLSGDALFVTHTCGAQLDADALWVSRTSVGTGLRVDVIPADAHVASGLSESGAGLVALSGGSQAILFSSTYNASTRVLLWSSAAPTAPTLLTDDTSPKAFSRFVRPTLVSFPSLDGEVKIHAQLFRPSSDDAQAPAATAKAATNGAAAVTPAAAIFTHGGSQRQMYAAMHFSPTYARLYALCQQLAIESGTTVLSINYRSGVGYGRNYRLCGPLTGGGAPLTHRRRCGSRGALEYDDVKAGRAYLDSLFKPPTLAPRVGIFGLSYGGLNCLQAMSRDAADYHAGVCNAPVFNWVSQMRFDGSTIFDPAPKLPYFLHQLPVGPTSAAATPGWPSQAVKNAQVAYESSPASRMTNITGPLLLIQGDLDEEVPFQESLSLARVLRDRGADVETLFLPDECHGECGYANQLSTLSATAAYLVKHLSSERAPRHV